MTLPLLARGAALAAAAAVTAGCFSSEMVIRVKPDGSGTIEQVNLANAQMIGMATGMAQAAAKEAGAEGAADLDLGNLFDEAELKKAAAALGPGVRYVSSEKITKGPMQGARAVYAFDDVSALTAGGRAGGSAASGSMPTPQLAFTMAPRPGGGTLTVRFPEPPGRIAQDRPAREGAPDAAMKDIPPEALAMVKSMFEGARVSIALEVDGRIVKSNAPAWSGSRATLLELDFGQLLSDPSKFAALQTLKPGVDFETVRKTLAGVPGVKIPAESTVTIDFAR